MNNITYFTETNTKPNLQTVGVYRRFFDLFLRYNNTAMDDKEMLLQIFDKAWEHYKYFLPDELSTIPTHRKLDIFRSNTDNDTDV